VAALLPLTFHWLPLACAQNPLQNPSSAASKVLLDFNNDLADRLKSTSNQVTVTPSQNPAAPGILVTIQPGPEGYPGINIKPAGAPWNLAGYGHVEARVVNTGAKPISVALRVDGAGDWKDNPWNAESVYLQPGATGTVTTIFGYSYGHKPGYALKPEAVVNMMLFTTKADEVQSFRVESLVAGGPAGEKPPVAPDDVRVQPKDGILLGAGVTLDAETQLTNKNADSSLVNMDGQQALRIALPAVQGDAAKGEQEVTLKPAIGRWDLRDALQVRVKVQNAGQIPVVPRLRLESNGGPSDWITPTAPLGPGVEQEIVIPFASATIANLGQKGTGSRLVNDAVSGLTVTADKVNAARVLLVKSVRSEMPPTPQLPAWLGQRPPIDGDWVKTLDDEFDGTTLDQTLWDVYGANYWDKQSHWSKDDVLLGGGVVRLRYEKKTGFNNDDPTQAQTNYAAGYLHTYNKWAQRYGYFEARMKLPKAPGLWPAFWMMPDRGAAVGPQWKRQDTANGGMEFDIMEHLTRWGSNRYNIAMHYDGYDKDHKSIGADKIYVQPDKEGFITCGLLWTPGSAIYYCNGQEVARWEDPRISNVPSILMFTLPMGGWDNNSLDDAQLPAEFVVDYVRVWQRKDLASAADGKQPASQAEVLGTGH